MWTSKLQPHCQEGSWAPTPECKGCRWGVLQKCRLLGSCSRHHESVCRRVQKSSFRNHPQVILLVFRHTKKCPTGLRASQVASGSWLGSALDITAGRLWANLHSTAKGEDHSGKRSRTHSREEQLEGLWGCAPVGVEGRGACNLARDPDHSLQLHPLSPLMFSPRFIFLPIMEREYMAKVYPNSFQTLILC